MDPAEESRTDKELSGPFEIIASVAQKVTFATQQNDVPVIAELAVRNLTDRSYESLTLHVSSDTNLLAPRTWRLDQVATQGEIRISDRQVYLDGARLSELNERLVSKLRFELRQGDEVLALLENRLIGLARNEWGGAYSMPELLAAFVTSNDPAVSKILKDAGEALRKNGLQPALNGYQSQSRKRVWEIVSALWTSISEKRFVYAEPPASFETDGQKIRFPSTILDEGLMTCLDSALLFAACAEQSGLNPIVIFTKGHAFCGIWLQPIQLPTLTVEDPLELRKYVSLNDMVIFETTLVVNEPPVKFTKAINEAQRLVAEEYESEFVYALDIKRARARQIAPLPAVGTQTLTGSSTVSATTSIAVDPAPDDLPAFDSDIKQESLPETPETRLDNWRRKLLDLTKRNRLLNLRSSKTAIKLYCNDPARLEDKLAEGKKISVIPMPAPRAGSVNRDGELFRERTGDDLKKRFIEEALERNEIVAELDEKDLDTGLVQLYRKARLDLAEGGANTLFLALGMLKWKQKDDNRNYRAPLILMPVKLERASAKSKVRIVQHDDSTVFNMTLREMLRQDFELELPTLGGDLPKDDSGVDVPRIWDDVRRAVRDTPGFELVEDIVLSTFSFAKYLMWKDLSDRTDELKNSALVRHLIDSPKDRYRGSSEFIKANEIDEKIDPKNLYMPLPADASQVTAVYASTAHGDFVLEGPPGTGKSQTIANIIAQNLALGRRVLFVSEKMAALNVVYKRLRDVGLGDFCLELHSNKANKKEVIQQLGTAWRNRNVTTQENWQLEANKVKDIRNGLNCYVAALHRPCHSGITPHSAMGRAVRYREGTTVQLDWKGSISEDPIRSVDNYEQTTQVAHELGISWAGISRDDKEAFKLLQTRDWSMEWQRTTVSNAHEVRTKIQQLRDAAGNLIRNLSLSIQIVNMSHYKDLSILAEQVPIAAEYDLSVGLALNGTDCIKDIKHILTVLEDYRVAKAKLSLGYSDTAIYQAPLADWQEFYERAHDSWLPLRTVRMLSLRRHIAKFAGIRRKPNIENDLSTLKELQPLSVELGQFGSKYRELKYWAGADTDSSILKRYADSCQSIRNTTAHIIKDISQLPAMRAAIYKAFVENRELLTADMPGSLAALSFLTAYRNFEVKWASFAQLVALSSEDTITTDDLGNALSGILEREQRLKAWCQWQAASKRARSAGLGVLVDALEQGLVESEKCVDAFKTIYFTWLAERLIDDRDELRNFSSLSHEEKIRDFVELDSKLSKLSVDYIRAKLSGNIPDPDTIDRPKGYGILAHELQKKMRHKPIRELVSEMGSVLTDLTPCLMMSPLSVAQFLSADTNAMFDIVVFDEASQITVWDAIGAIARGKNAIIVGDPKQMPPTRFFDRAAEDEEDANAADLDSILDEAIATGVKWHRLTGHYRSKHESLIAFSNHRYYEGDLVTYPSSDTKLSAVHFHKVEGLYQRGSGRTNPDEAKAVVREVIERLSRAEESYQSIGIVTLNSEQQRLIDDLLDNERRRDPSLERYFSDDIEEPVFVKNLETVQGDQRDVILLSIGYGPDTPGAKTMPMNFGPLTHTGGERRLNVAITRATTEVVIFSSFDPSMIDLTRTSATAVRDLKHYMEFAQRGPTALGEAIQSVGGYDQYDSDFEHEVADRLRQHGWTIQTQIGISKFRIDLGVVHPDVPGKYLAGIECDGATYHSLPSARDRDRIRQSILEGLGWKLLRIWSTDYFIDPKTTIGKIHDSLTSLLGESRKSLANEKLGAADDSSSTQKKGLASQLDESHNIKDDRYDQARVTNPDRLQRVASYSVVDSSMLGQSSELSPSKFYEDEYRGVIKSYASKLIDRYGPITFDHLCEKIARAHGFQRTGKLIRDQIWKAISRTRTHTKSADHRITFWPNDVDPSETSTYRGLKISGEERRWHDVPYSEKLALAQNVLKKSEGNDQVDIFCREIGIARLTKTTRTELEALLATAKRHVT